MTYRVMLLFTSVFPAIVLYCVLSTAPLTVYHLLMRSDTYVNTGNQLSQPKTGTSFLLIFKSRSGLHYTP